TGGPCSCAFLMSTQKRLSGSRRRCHAYDALPFTAIVTVAPAPEGCDVTPVTTADWLAGVAFGIGAFPGFSVPDGSGSGVGDSSAMLCGDAFAPLIARATSRAPLFCGGRAEAPGCSATVTVVTGARTVPLVAIWTERTPPALICRVPASAVPTPSNA